MTGKDLARTIAARIGERVTRSADLIERMGVTPAQFERVALNALALNPALARCTVDSLDRAILRCAEIGLLPDGIHAAIVPMGNQATLLPMIAGRLALARQAMPGLAVRARCVYAADEFEFEDGLEPVLRHRPASGGARTHEEIIAVYAVARLPGADQPEFEVLWRADIDRYRSYSQARSSPWERHYDEMAEKAALGLLLKRLPQRPGFALPVETADLEAMDLTPEPASAPTPDETDTDEAPPPPPPKPEPAPPPKPRAPRKAAPKPKSRPTPKPEPARAPPESPPEPPPADHYEEIF